MLGEDVCEPPAKTASDLRDAPLDILCAEAQAQEEKYVSGEPSYDTAGVELFRRAIADRDDAAWAAVVGLYRGLLLAQASRQALRKLVDEDDGFCVDRAFQRFWRATRTSAIFEFNDLASILKYLKMCLWSVLLDEARHRKRTAFISLDDMPPTAQMSIDPAAVVTGRLARRELWEAIDRELRNDSERLVARLSFVGGLTPREILARHPDHFASVSEVYHRKRNVIDRLRRSQAIQRLLD